MLPGLILTRDAVLLKSRLVGTDLTWSNLRGADLTGSVLAHACLDDTDLRESQLRDIDLRRVSFQNARLGAQSLTVPTCPAPAWLGPFSAEYALAASGTTMRQRGQVDLNLAFLTAPSSTCIEDDRTGLVTGRSTVRLMPSQCASYT
jgi:Pentapeptide repeats (8 copies)